MASYTTTAERIIRQPALTMPGNATGAEAACTSLTASQIRTLLSLGTVDSPSFSGMTLSGHLLFNATNTYDIGNGTYDPRTVRAATSVLTPLLNNTNAAALIVGNSSYGVTFPGNVTCPGTSGDQTERWGKQAAATVYGGSAFGAYANASGYGGTAIGSFAAATTYAIAIGHATFTSQSSVTIGYNAGSATSFQYVAIGQSATPGSHHHSIALGMGATNTASNQFQIGAATVPITQTRWHTNGGSLTLANETGTFLTAANNGLLTLGNSTYGVTVPGAAVVSGDISMSKTSAQGYINIYSPDSSKLMYMYANNSGTGSMVATTSIRMSSASGSVSVTNNQIAISPTSGNAYVFVGGTNSTFDVYDSSGVKYSRLTHDGTNGILSTSSGNLNLVPTGGTVAVTGAVTASGNVSYAQGLSTGTVTKSANYTTTADDYCVNVTANSIDITFETAVGCANREHEVINSGSGVVTLKTTSAQTISGSASGALTLAQWKSIRVKSDGANWLIMSQIT